MYQESSESLLTLMNQTWITETYTGHDKTIFTTWEISFATIQRDSPAAADLLLLCSFFADTNLWEGILIYPRRSEQRKSSRIDED